MSKKLMAWALALVMVLSVLPMAAMATGTEAELTISTEAELIDFAENIATYADATVQLGADIKLTKAWSPIGGATRKSTAVGSGTAFSGTFDGQGHTISGLTISGDAYVSDVCVGLFSALDGATVKDLELDVAINVPANDCAGAVAGLVVGNTTISGVTVSGTIAAAESSGGLVGRMIKEGHIENCVNNTTITGGGKIGGIVGGAYYQPTNTGLSITDCVNNGTVTSTAGYVGGIAGLSAGVISGCENTAAITGANTGVGGIVGEQSGLGTVTECVNTGKVTNNASAYGTGGIVGWTRYADTTNYTVDEIEITDNVNYGTIAGGSDAGGIIGTLYNAGTVTGNKNYAASLTGTVFAAGIVANLQYDANNGFAKEDGVAAPVTITGNSSATAEENISASCTNLYVYNNEDTYFTNVKDNGVAYVAEIDGYGYTTLAAAVAAAGEGDTITLLDDITLTDALVIAADGKITLDLNGKTVTSDAAITITSGNVTVKNGTINSKSHAFRLGVNGAADDSADTAVLNIAADAKVTAADCVVVIFAGTLNTAGTLETSTENYAAIQGNGNSNNDGTVINITGGSITGTSADSMAIYHPQDGELNISGGAITAGSGVFVKAGDVTVTGGTITATYIAEDNESMGDGASTTGIAFVVETNAAYAYPSVMITGGTFISENSVAVGSFADAENTPITGFISGGTYSSDPTDYVAEGYVASQRDENTWIVGTPVAQAGDVQYSDLQAAVNAVESGTVTLLTDLTIDETLTITKPITLDLNTKTLTGVEGINVIDINTNDAENAVVVTNGSVTGDRTGNSNGVIKVIDGALDLTNATVTNDGQNALRIQSSGIVTIENCTVNGNINTVYGASCEFKSGTFTGTSGSSVPLGTAVVVTGGTFAHDPSANIHEDCGVTANSDGTWTVTSLNVGNAVAEANGAYFNNLAEAVEAAEAGSTVTLLKDDTGAGLNFWTKDLTIDLGGNTYTVDEGAGDLFTTALHVRSGYTVVVKNGTLAIADKSGLQINYYVRSYGDLTLTDVTIDGTNGDVWGVVEGETTEVGFVAVGAFNGTLTIDGESNITNAMLDDVSAAIEVWDWEEGGYNGVSASINTTGTIDGAIVVGSDNETDPVVELTISGGTYTEDPSDYVAEGYEAVEGDGVWTVEEDKTLATPEVFHFLTEDGLPELHWLEVEGADYYYVFRTAEDGLYYYLTRTTALEVVDTTAVYGTEYGYMVRAVALDANGQPDPDSYSDYSRKEFITAVEPVVEPLDAPVAEIALDDEGLPVISWDEVEGTDYYYVFRNAGDGYYYYMTRTTGLEVTDADAVYGTEYGYMVRAVALDEAGQPDPDSYSEYSAKVFITATEPGIEPLDAPELSIDVEGDSGKPELSWDEVDGADRYYIFRSTTRVGGYAYLDDTAKLSLIDEEAEVGVTYFYKVRAIMVDEDGAAIKDSYSEYSNIESITCTCARPEVEIALNSQDNPKLTWDEVDGAERYYIYRSTSKWSGYSLWTWTSKTSIVNNTDDIYYYQVLACDRDGDEITYSAPSSPVCLDD